MLSLTPSVPTPAKAAAAAAAGGGVTAAKAVAAMAGSLADGLVLRGSDEDGGSSSSCGGSVVDMECAPVKSLLDSVLLAMWEECSEQGLFRYDVTACPTKVVPGLYGFVAQLNEGRYSKKRPTEFRVDQVIQPFDHSKFNFTKAFRREVLFAFEPALPGIEPTFEESGKATRSPNLVLINVSPIEYGHVLLCPRVLDCLPQNIDPSTTRLALHFALEVGNPYLRVGFNSLGAFATINHLHFQAYYLAAPLPCERAPMRPLRLKSTSSNSRKAAAGSAGDFHPVSISLLVDYPVRGWVVEGPSLAGMAQVVGEASLAMQAANIPHNVLIADCGSRVFIWPQAYAERQAKGLVPEHLLDIGVNPAIWEISGHMVLKRAQDYDDFTEARAWELLAAVSLDESDMDRLSEQLFGDSGEPVGKGLSVGGFAQAAAPSVAAAGGAEGGVSAGSAKAAAVTAAQGNGLVAAACS
jgi:GDP-L-galactose phosphorylase